MSLQERIPGPRASAVDLFVSEGSALVTPAGELDISNAGELREQLARPDVLAARQVCVDLNMVGFLDSTCIVSSSPRASGYGLTAVHSLWRVMHAEPFNAGSSSKGCSSTSKLGRPVHQDEGGQKRS